MQSPRQTQLTEFFKCRRNAADEKAKSATIRASQRVSKSKRLVPVSLPLPVKYGQLLEKYRHCDAIVGRLYGRSERCSVERLIQSVEAVTKLRMSKRNLGQIITVNPNAFRLAIENLKTVDRKMKEDIFVYPDFTDYPDSDQIVTPTFLSRRLIKFRRILLQKTIKAHEEFLSLLPVPIAIDSSRLRRWHPHFDLECAPPDIPAAPLPQPNKKNGPEEVTGKMLLELGKTIKSERMKRVLSKIAERKEVRARAESDETNRNTASSSVRKYLTRQVSESVKAVDKSNEANIDSSSRLKEILEKLPAKVDGEKKASSVTADKKPLDKAGNIARARQVLSDSSRLKGISEKLLQRIRQREEKEKMETLITSAPEYADELKKAELPKFVRTIRNYFLIEQRVVLPATKVRKNVFDSMPGITTDIYEMCLEGALKEFPNWITTVAMRGVEYLKVRRSVDVNKLLKSYES